MKYKFMLISHIETISNLRRALSTTSRKNLTLNFKLFFCCSTLLSLFLKMEKFNYSCMKLKTIFRLTEAYAVAIACACCGGAKKIWKMRLERKYYWRKNIEIQNCLSEFDMWRVGGDLRDFTTNCQYLVNACERKNFIYNFLYFIS